ncbi:MAG: glycosyltransferase family 4 protein [Candidatus Dojkabacteria bacterium]|nr:glycosyltransferase family 4 protein [Candidatus Dojkabacteria bacterium]MDQ7020443.1 glycosyltransferase family 4 protein [Candidatus Dojkabacteria bacterium]
MRIIFYSYEYPPLGGGVGNATKKIFTEFSKLDNLKIDFITSSISGKYEEEKVYKNITFYKLPLGKRTKENYHKQKPLNMILFSWKAYWKTWSLILKNKYCLTHFFGFPGGLVSLLFIWKMPYMVSLRGVDVPGYNPRFKYFYIFYKPLSWVIWKLAKYVVPNSKGLQKLAYKTSKTVNYKVIYNGIDTEQFKPVEEDKKFPVFTVTQGGTLFGRKKGLEYLIQGFAYFTKKYSNTKLLMIASGDLEIEYKQLVKDLNIEDKVEFVGFKENNWIAENLPKCHVFCLPSLNEGMSNAALEALASGLPLILTDTGGTEELLKYKNGLVVDKKNPKSISNALEKIYLDKELRLKMNEQSRRRANEMSWKAVAEEYLNLYQSIAYPSQ